MNDFFGEIIKNKALWVTMLSWFIAQSAKIAHGVIREKKLNFSWILGTGGMPSSHSAAVSSLATCVGIELGFNSAFFALATIFALVTMFDAQTWRRSVGFQAKILNWMMNDIHTNKKIGDNRLRELVGHTPFEVFIGASIGVIMPFFFYH